MFGEKAVHCIAKKVRFLNDVVVELTYQERVTLSLCN